MSQQHLRLVPNAPDGALVKMLETLLDEARSGELQSLYGVMLLRGNGLAWVQCDPSPEHGRLVLVALLGQLEILKSKLLAELTPAVEPVDG